MQEEIVYKVVTAGDGGVGKTTIIHRYVEGKFIQNTQMTIGVEFSVKKLSLDNRAITLQLWDFTGQAHLRFMLERYIYGSQGALFMFDLNNINRSLRNIEIWWDILKGGGEIPILLVGTKYDLIENNRKRYDLFKQKIDAVRDKYNFIDFIQTSSKSGYNVDEAFIILINKIIETGVY
jgi:small GTP-binding protein